DAAAAFGSHSLREAAMIRGVHTMFYTSQPDELRAFLRDKLGFPHSDLGDGWLIFDLPEADMGCHPASAEDGAHSGTHSISFYCDDIEKTVAELKVKGVEFIDAIANHGYGLVTHFKVPGNFAVQLYNRSTRRIPRDPKRAPQSVRRDRRTSRTTDGPNQSGGEAEPLSRNLEAEDHRRA